MASMSLFDRIKTIFELVGSQSFFITVFVMLLLTAGLLIANIKLKSKAPKYAVAIIYVGLSILILVRYGKYILSLNDSIVDKFFRAMYFPNLVVYLSMLIITVLLFLYIIIDERFSLFSKIENYISFFLIWFFFVLVVDTVKQNNLNFYEVKDLYANTTVMVLLQASMCVFIIWVGITIIDLVVRKLSIKMDEKQKLDQDKVDNSKNMKELYEKIIVKARRIYSNTLDKFRKKNDV